MKTITKRILLISLTMMLAGVILTAIGFALGGTPGVTFTRRGISSASQELESYQQEKTKIDAFKNLNIRIDSYADIQVLPSEDDHFYLEYSLDGSYAPPVFTENDTFTFTQSNNENGLIGIDRIQLIGFGTYSTSPNASFVNFYVPEDQQLQDVRIYQDYGDALIQDLKCSNLELSLESGSLELVSSSAKVLTLDDSYGNVSIRDFSTDTADVTLESGDLELENSKITDFIFYSEYGDVNIRNFSGGTADLTMEYGDLTFDAETISKITCDSGYGEMLIQLPEDLDAYTINAKTEYGNIFLPDDAPYTYYSSDEFEAVYRKEGSADKTISLITESGDITLQTRE